MSMLLGNKVWCSALQSIGGTVSSVAARRALGIALAVCAQIVSSSACLAAANVEISPPGPYEYRFGSPDFLVLIEIRNTGDDELVVEQIRLTCSSCVRVSVSQQRVSPGGAAKLTLRGRRRTEEPLTLSCFIVSNDPDEQVKELKIRAVCSRDYACGISWQGTNERRDYPYEPARLCGIQLWKQRSLCVDLMSLKAQELGEVRANAGIFALSQVTLQGNRASLVFESRIAAPGIYHDDLVLHVNGDSIVVPVEVLIYGRVHPAEADISFQFLPQGQVRKCDLTIAFEGGTPPWNEVSLERSEAQQDPVRLVSLAKAPEAGTLTATVEVDSRLLGDKGPKWLPVVLTNGTERVFFSLTGYVY